MWGELSMELSFKSLCFFGGAWQGKSPHGYTDGGKRAAFSLILESEALRGLLLCATYGTTEQLGEKER